MLMQSLHVSLLRDAVAVQAKHQAGDHGQRALIVNDTAD